MENNYLKEETEKGIINEENSDFNNDDNDQKEIIQGGSIYIFFYKK